MKSIWTGAIAFGLVNIPVKIFSASQSSDLDLDMLDKNDLANIHLNESMPTLVKKSSTRTLLKVIRSTTSMLFSVMRTLSMRVQRSPVL